MADPVPYVPPLNQLSIREGNLGRAHEVKREAIRAVFELGSFKAAAAALGVTLTELQRWWRDPSMSTAKEEICREEWIARVPDSTLLATQLMTEIGNRLESGQMSNRDMIFAYDVITEKVAFWQTLGQAGRPLGRLRGLDPELQARDLERHATLVRELRRRRELEARDARESTVEVTANADSRDTVRAIPDRMPWPTERAPIPRRSRATDP